MTITLLPETAALFFLIFARVGGLVMLLPALGEQAVPVRIRLILALLLSLLFYPLGVAALPADMPGNGFRFLLLLMGEALTGIALGLLARLILSVAQTAGATIAAHIGLGFAQAVDPTMGQQGAIFGGFLAMAGVTLIFVLDLHHLSIAAIAESYRAFPPGLAPPLQDFKDAAVMIISEAFWVGITLAAPFMAFGLIFNLGLGVLAKLMPQLQVFFLGMPVTIGIGLFLFMALLPGLLTRYANHIEQGLMRLIGG